jgi:NhaP-type Na+/H+ or K+/H+ antiporter
MQEQKFFSRRSVWIVFITTLLSLVGATLVTPRFIDWYAAPFMPQGAQGISCAPTIQWALSKFLWVQLGSVVFGLLMGLFFVFKFRSRSGQHNQT